MEGRSRMTEIRQAQGVSVWGRVSQTVCVNIEPSSTSTETYIGSPTHLVYVQHKTWHEILWVQCYTTALSSFILQLEMFPCFTKISRFLQVMLKVTMKTMTTLQGRMLLVQQDRDWPRVQSGYCLHLAVIHCLTGKTAGCPKWRSKKKVDLQFVLFQYFLINWSFFPSLVLYLLFSRPPPPLSLSLVLALSLSLCSPFH